MVIGIHGLLDVIRNLLLKIAEFLAKYIPFKAEGICLIIFLLLSIFISKKILEYFPLAMDDWGWISVLALIIFYFLKIW